MNRQSRSRVKNEIKTFWAASSLAAILLLGAAVLQINDYIHQNTQLSDYKKQIASLSSKNDSLEGKLSQTNSLENFNEYAVAQGGNYEKVDVASVLYVHAVDGQLAKR
jgi:cell division protein FtsB